MAKEKGFVGKKSHYQTGGEFRNNVYTTNRKKHPVSQYAGDDAAELFSESFAAYTSPKYKRGSLPSDIEKFLDTHIGGI